MNISFHYFAVKTLALEAGFCEAYAQTIAVFSQYIDDYNAFYYRRYEDIPEWVKDKAYDMYLPSKTDVFNFNPVTTGFWDKLDYVNMLTDRYQTFIISPFHFIPQSNFKMDQKDFKTCKATLGDQSIISNELEKAKMQYTDNHKTDEERRDILMLIGSRLHTFADTYAHEDFSGYFDYCNTVYLQSVTNNIGNSGKDETEKYKHSIDKYIKKIERIIKEAGYKGIPFALGHMMLGHLPDYPWLTYTYLTTIPNEEVITRNNTEIFLSAGEQIYSYLCSCLGKEVGNEEWNSIKKKMEAAFSFDETDEKYNTESKLMEGLVKHWKGVFFAEGYQYSYDRHAIFDGIIRSMSTSQDEENRKEDNIEFNCFPKMEEDFYRFNAYADQLLISLYGEAPRNN